jgi:hypothetical protein
MNSPAKLREDEAFAIASLEKEFGGTQRIGENPPDAYLQIDARTIAVEISTLTQYVVTDDGGTRPRLSDDKPAINLANELNSELSDLISGDQSVGLILSAPIQNFRSTKTALANLLRAELLNPRSFATETEITINGNVIRIQRHPGRSGAKIWGIVPNRHSSPDILGNARNILEDRIAVNGTCQRQ